MKLYVSGVKVPPLFSLQDRVIREYFTRQEQLESKKQEMMMLLALTSPNIQDPAKGREWSELVKNSWTQYLGALFNVKVDEMSDKEKEMREYYEAYMKNSKITLHVDKKKKSLSVSGIEALIEKPGKVTKAAKSTETTKTTSAKNQKS
jgi:hypothetical protein